MQRVLAVVAVASLGAVPAWSQVPMPEDPETEVTIGRNTQLSGRLGFGGPTGASVTLRLLRGLGADVKEEDTRVNGVCGLPIPHCAGGFLLELDAGSGGGKLSLGVGARAKVKDEDFRGAFGFGLKASVARTWGSPLGTERGLTYLGPELDLQAMRLELTLGVLWRVSGGRGAGAVFSWGLGVGL